MTAHPQPPSSSLAALLAHIALAPRQAHKALTVWPLLRRPDAPTPIGPAYVPLADALRSGDLNVDEVSEGGSVPHARVGNRGESAVLVLFGEELRGAMQNRIANASFLVPGHSEIVIDVSCVEQGRWGRRRGARFEDAERVVSHALRRKMHHKIRAMKAAGMTGFASDQSEIWADVRQRLEHSRTASPTQSYEDYARSRGTDVREISRAFRPLDRQVGFVAAIGDEIVGAEVIGRPEVFAGAFQRLLHGYAIDAVDVAFLRPAQEAAPAPQVFDAPEEFLQALGEADATSGPSLGAGEDVRIDGQRVAGCALVAGEVVHLTAFPQEVA